jgi:hypothetical protein
MATVPKLNNLPGVVSVKNDYGLAPSGAASAPRVLILGTASQGRGSDPYLVRTSSLAKGEFGTDGTLMRGFYEAKRGGAEEVVLFRFGATPAILEGIGSDGTAGEGYTVTTIMEDDTAGATYGIYYDDAADRLVVTNLDDDLVVFDNDATTPIERFEVIVSGYRMVGTGGDDIGGPSVPVAMEDVTAAGSSYTAGTDGTSLSRMRTYEKLYKAYKLLAEYDFDVCIPMDVYLDDYNTVDQGNNQGAPVSDNGANTYPTAGDYKPALSLDSLGMVFVEEYQGDYYFFWRFGTSGATASIWPAGVGSASASLKIDGTSLAADDFHEVNFGYQLARFLFEYSTTTVEATGTIGVRPFDSYSLADLALWVGAEPTYTVNTSTGVYTIANPADDGTGLLGFKFMAGLSSYRAGAIGGGMIGTDSGFLDSGEAYVDDNDYEADVGKYLNVVVDWPFLFNDYAVVKGLTGYVASYAPSYGGFYSVLPPNSAPTNKTIAGATLYYKLGIRRMDLLAKRGYVVLREKSQGIVIADAPTASLPASDYKRLSTVRIVKDVIDAVRDALDPFIGEGTSDATRAAMHAAVDKVLLQAKKAGYLQNYREFTILQTPDMAVQGKAEVGLVLKPSFELREITVTVSLSKE